MFIIPAYVEEEMDLVNLSIVQICVEGPGFLAGPLGTPPAGYIFLAFTNQETRTRQQ